MQMMRMDETYGQFAWCEPLLMELRMKWKCDVPEMMWCGVVCRKDGGRVGGSVFMGLEGDGAGGC
jgi:hypothetical protein